METLSSLSALSVSLISNICILRSSAHCMGKDLISVYEVRWGEVRWGEVVITNVENMMDLWLWSFWWWTEVQYNQVMISPSPHCYHHLSKYFRFISQTIMTTSTTTTTTIYGRKMFITDSLRWHLTPPQGRVSCEFFSVWTLFVKRMMNSRYLNG